MVGSDWEGVLAADLCSARSQRRITDWASADATLNRYVQRRRYFDWPWPPRVLAAAAQR